MIIILINTAFSKFPSPRLFLQYLTFVPKVVKLDFCLDNGNKTT